MSGPKYDELDDSVDGDSMVALAFVAVGVVCLAVGMALGVWLA